MPISTINQNGLNAPLTLTAPILGTPASINLANATNLPKAALPTGSVLQVVSTTKTDTFSTATSVTAGGTAVTGMAATITPTSASNKILILFDGNTGSGPNTDQSYFFIKRNGTTVLPATVATGTQVNINTRTYTYSDGNIMYPVSWSGLDSPASTSALTYQVFLAGQGAGTVYFNRTAAFRDHPDGSPTSSTITLMEIAV